MLHNSICNKIYNKLMVVGNNIESLMKSRYDATVQKLENGTKIREDKC